MKDKSWRAYYNPLVGLTFRGDSNGIGRTRVYADSENCGLWLAIYYILNEEDRADIGYSLYRAFKNRRATIRGGVVRVDGLYDRGAGESHDGFSCNEKDHARTGSRDEMMAACNSKELAMDIVNMFFVSWNKFPNHYVESLTSFRLLFTKKAWQNFQFQFLTDLCYYALRSQKPSHNVIGWCLFPIYYLAQLIIPLTYTVTRHGNEKQMKNSGDQLFVLRDFWLQEYKFYKLVRVPLIYLFNKKWKNPVMKAEWKGNLYKTIIYNFHKCPWPGEREGLMRDHNFPITHILES